MNRKEPLITNEIYHVYNRGVDARKIFNDMVDLHRFIESIVIMNNKDKIFHLREHKKEVPSPEPLVTILGYCILNNHYHFLLRQEVDGGISEFMKRLGGGYTSYFNLRHKRSGSLFQGKFKSKHVSTDEHLHVLSAYVQANYCIHPKKSWSYMNKPKMVISSLHENTNRNPFLICPEALNVHSLPFDELVTSCEHQSQATYQKRLQDNNMQNFTIE